MKGARTSSCYSVVLANTDFSSVLFVAFPLQFECRSALPINNLLSLKGFPGLGLHFAVQP